VANCEVVPDDAPATIAAALERVLRTGARSTGRRAVQDLDENAIARGVIGVYRSVLGRDPAEPAGGVGLDATRRPAP
jgi:hypothetical protein